MKKTLGERHNILVEVYSELALAAHKWFAQFESGDFGLETLKDDFA